MNTKQFHRRVWAMVLLLALMVTGMGAALYDLQINNGDEYYAQTQKKIAENQAVPADRNGQVLVSNKVVYQVTLDLKLMGDDRNAILLDLVNIARDEGVEWADSLPISKTAPFQFETGLPYYTIVRDEDYNASKRLTYLGRFAVQQKWVDDPTLDPAPEEEPPAPQEPSLMDKSSPSSRAAASPPPSSPRPPSPSWTPRACSASCAPATASPGRGRWMSKRPKRLAKPFPP